MNAETDAREIDIDVAGCAAAHQGLLADLDQLELDNRDTDEDPAQRPSLLPGWSIGHILTHLARNADALANMIEAADRGEVADQYPGGRDQRENDIVLGAQRPLIDQITDVRRSIWELEATWARATSRAWSGFGRALTGEIPIAHLPHRRWREVEIHHVDLGIGYETSDWSADFVRRELARQTAAWKSRRPMGLTDLPSEALARPPHERLAWLVGRLSLPGVPDPGLMS
jgi:maleylpyruvate isomerase